MEKNPNTIQSLVALQQQMLQMLAPFGLSNDEIISQFGRLFDPFGLVQDQFNQQMFKTFDPFGITRAYLDVQRAWMDHPEQMLDWLMRLSTDSWALQLQCWERMSGTKLTDTVPVVEFDERFQDPQWTENPYLDTIKEFYLLFTRWTEDLIYDTPDISDKTRRKAAFWVRQNLNAIAPTNFFWTNPIAVRRFIETGGQSVIAGIKHLLADSKHKTIRMVEEDAFDVGKTLANTPGKVVYRNNLFELIQYNSSTEKVHQVPILFIPPWINKFYILDLGEKKSLVRYMVERGYTVFVISWKNPTSEMRNTTLDDYMLHGVLEAVNVAKGICNAPSVHAVGYCIGGIILTALMAWLDEDVQTSTNNPIASWSLFTTLVDFSNPGEIDVFIDEETITHIEDSMHSKGFLDGTKLADSFRILRSNTLVWHYFVHNYLYGEDLPAFDVLFWNMDNTRLPEAMHAFYLREFYLGNKFMKPNGVTLGGRPIDVRKIQQPLYTVATEQDHIAPWKESFKICGLVNAPIRQVLATSGHILGIISPPVNPPKRRYWVGEAKGQTDPELWRDQTPKVQGSWWEDWDAWLQTRCGELQTPPSTGNEQYKPLCDAPGTYVLEK
jgi:polyhydroxyalkanoate synthase